MAKEYKEGDGRLFPPYRSSMPNVGGQISPNYRSPGQRVTGVRIEADVFDEDGNLVRLGEMNECSVPHLPYEKWVNPAGFVIPLVVGTNRDHRQPDPNLRRIARDRQKKAGGIPYDYKVAREMDFEQTQDEQQWEKYRDQKIKLLRERNDIKQSRFAHIGLSELEKMRRQGMAADDLAVKLTKPKRKRGNPGGEAA